MVDLLFYFLPNQNGCTAHRICLWLISSSLWRRRVCEPAFNTQKPIYFGSQVYFWWTDKTSLHWCSKLYQLERVGNLLLSLPYAGRISLRYFSLYFVHLSLWIDSIDSKPPQKHDSRVDASRCARIFTTMIVKVSLFAMHQLNSQNSTNDWEGAHDNQPPTEASTVRMRWRFRFVATCLV